MADGVRGQGPLLEPRRRLLRVDLAGGRLGEGIVVPDRLEEAPVTRRPRVRHHHPVGGTLGRPRPSEPDPCPHVILPLPRSLVSSLEKRQGATELSRTRPSRHAPDPLHHLTELRVLLEQSIHVLDRRPAPPRDPTPPVTVDDGGRPPLPRRPRADDRLAAPELPVLR